MNIMLDSGAIMPTRAHRTDAGLDLYSPCAFKIEAHDSITIDTGIHIDLELNTVGMLKSKSGLNVKYGIVSEGVIDEGYTGSIKVKLYNHSDNRYCGNAGDKITQLVVLPVVYVDVNLVDEFPKTERGNNGFGSTGV